jgi:hypothetical protein
VSQQRQHGPFVPAQSLSCSSCAGQQWLALCCIYCLFTRSCMWHGTASSYT